MRDKRKYYSEVRKRMTKKEKVVFWIITTVIILLFLLVIAGGIIFGITNKPWLLIGGVICFIGFGLSFPMIGRVKRKFILRAITKNPKAIEEQAKIASIWIGWHWYKKSKVTALTLNIRCNINGIESQSWYKLNSEELKNVETEAVLEHSSAGASLNNYSGPDTSYIRYEVKQEELDKLFKIGDGVVVKYILNNPKYCIILRKI